MSTAQHDKDADRFGFGREDGSADDTPRYWNHNAKVGVAGRLGDDGIVWQVLDGDGVPCVNESFSDIEDALYAARQWYRGRA